VRVLTELLNPVAFGELALGMTVAVLFNQTILGPLGNGVSRFYAPAQEKSDLASYLNAVLRLAVLASGVIVFLTLLAISGLFIGGWKQWIPIATIAIVFATLSGYNSILVGMHNSARHRSIVALHHGMESWVRFSVAAGLMLWLGTTSTVAMAGYSIALLLVLASQAVFFPKLRITSITNPDNEKFWRRQIIVYSAPFATWGIFSWAQFVSDRWAMEFFTSTQEVGLYAVLFQVGYYPMIFVTGALTQFLAPILFQRAGDASDARRIDEVQKLSWRLTGLELGLTGAAFLVAITLHAQIFSVFAATEYASVSYLMPWMLLAGGIFAAGQTVSLDLMSQMKTQVQVVPKIATAVLGVTFNFTGAYLFGITGIVSANILFATIYFVWIVMISRKSSTRLTETFSGK